jgi:hypothetical protein
MAANLLEAEMMQNAFAGNRDRHCITKIKGYNEKLDKVETESYVKDESVSTAMFLDHLNGITGLGMMPIAEGDYIKFCAIDLDHPNYPIEYIVRAIYDYDMPILPCYSKSKKLHLYFFTKSNHVKAETMQDMMYFYITLFSLPKSVEIYPLQKELTSAGNCNWINLPYFAASSDNCRKALDKNNNLMSLSAALDRIQTISVSITEHKEYMQKYPFNDAPPCLQTCLMTKYVIQNRNTFMYSFAAYLSHTDLDPDEIPEMILDFNKQLEDPLPEEELQRTVIKSVLNRTYYYKCKEEPCVSLCNKQRCKDRLFGYASDRMTGLEYGKITQLMTDPPSYTWEVNGVLMKFYNEQDLLSQEKFRILTVRYLHVAIPMLKQNDWIKILNKALSIIEVDEKPALEGLTSGDQFKNLFYEYLAKSSPGQEMDDIKRMRTVLVDEKYIFDSSRFIHNVRNSSDFKSFSIEEMMDRLLNLGCTRIGHKSKTYMTVPVSAIPVDDIVLKQKDCPVDFKEVEQPNEKY